MYTYTMFKLNMSKTKALVSLAVVSLILGISTSPAFSSTLKSTWSGTCYNGSSWTLTMSRSGSNVTTSMVVTKLPKGSQWNINYAYPNTYQVANLSGTADKKGNLSFRHSISSQNEVYALVMVDSWASPNIPSTTYCIASGTK